MFARRRGDDWFLAVLNGPTARTIKVPLSFLTAAKYEGWKCGMIRASPPGPCRENSGRQDKFGYH